MRHGPPASRVERSAMELLQGRYFRVTPISANRVERRFGPPEREREPLRPKLRCSKDADASDL